MKERYVAFGCYSENCPVEWVYSDEYEIVVDMQTNKVVCMLGEAEDRSFGRDLSGLITLLNKLASQ